MRLNCGEGNDVYLAGRTSLNTARIARIVCKVYISKDFVRAVLSWGIDRQWIITDRSRKYRPLSGHMEICCLAGLSPPR
jgi:hypothetical protein